ncbi:MAG: efflux RND transporter permease subunit [Sphingomonadales bacterium]|jgi:multidrug efflux pump subunit AcrB
MNLTASSLKNPAAVAVMAAIIVFLGMLSITKLPLQLFPNIERKQISVLATWRAASPQEVESEIVEPIEEVLQGISGMEQMEVYANRGSAWVNLNFGADADMDSLLLDVISRINRLPPLPLDADRPQVFAGNAWDSNAVLIYYFAQVLPGNNRDINDYSKYIQDRVVPKIESIEGVSRVRLDNRQSQDELQVVFDPYKAAELGVTIPNIAALTGRSNDVSAGTVDVGRRQYGIRYVGRYNEEELKDLILDWRNERPVRLGDIAEIKVAQPKRTAFAYQNGNPAIGMAIMRQSGANVLETVEKVNAAIEEMNGTILAEQGLHMEKSFNPAVFIQRAIGLLTNNLGAGILMAVGILWLFLRQARATALIALAIPMSLLGTFIILSIAGRSLNVISLAGLAFATGMVLDAAIVVLENIVRLREKGLDATEAAHKGTMQVWGALLASTATTIAIFIPVIFISDAEGQLFADLALTIAIGVALSLVVAVTILPTATRLWLKKLPEDKGHHQRWVRLADRIAALTATPTRRRAIIGALILAPVAISWMLFPRLDYLPPVRRDAVDAWFSFPAGMTIDVAEEDVAQRIIERLAPYMKGEKEPALLNYYVNTWLNGQGGSIGVRAKDQGDVQKLLQVVQTEVLPGLPDIQAFAMQGFLFGGFGNDGSIAIHVQSSDPQTLRNAAALGQQKLIEVFPGARVQANPDPSVSNPELALYPNDERIAEAGFSRPQIANIVQALGEGQYVGEYFDGEARLFTILKADAWSSPEELERIPIATPNGAIIPLGQLVHVERTVGPGQIARVDRRRTISLTLFPPQGMALQDSLEKVQSEVEPVIREALDTGGSIRYGGSADSLKRAINTMSSNFLTALFLLFLIMAALFKSVKDSLLVVVSIPLAAFGGIIALRLLGLVTFAPLDLLTMIGFIIMLGLVVNNAILLVVQTRRSQDEGLERDDAVAQALRLRLRPIFMSTLTTLFGMLPLVLFPGAGSAIYRGMATAIVGGMAVSTLFTLLLLPSLLRSQGLDLALERVNDLVRRIKPHRPLVPGE